jgi:hypothetical protein
MSRSLGKSNFDKIGLAAIVINKKLRKEFKCNKYLITELSAIVFAETSELLDLPRPELEKLATSAKGENVSWGSYTGFIKERRPEYIKYLKSAINR